MDKKSISEPSMEDISKRGLSISQASPSRGESGRLHSEGQLKKKANVLVWKRDENRKTEEGN